jgi:enoyl-CoA hydratase/carnithine racemase
MSITSESRDGVCCIGLARPARKNAISLAMYAQLAEAIETAERDDSVAVILLHGDPTVFCAGNDIQDFLEHPPTAADSEPVRFMQALRNAQKPVVAAVNGAAVGIGTTMLMHCDLVYCADDAMFSMPFVNLGLCPEFASSLLLPLTAGYHRAAEKLLLGEPISAEEALDMGIVNRLVPPAAVMETALHQARRLCALPHQALRESKRLLKSHWHSAIEGAMRDELRSFSRLLGSAESREALQAFLERRKPDYSRAREAAKE